MNIQAHDYVVVCMGTGTSYSAAVGCALLGTRRDGYTLEKLCTDPDVRGQGVATSIISCAQGLVRGLQEKLTLHVDRGHRHDELVRFYSKRGFERVYTNDMETCMMWQDKVQLY